MKRSICVLAFLWVIAWVPVFGLELGDTLKVDKQLIPFQSGFIHYRVKDQKLQLIFLNKKKQVIAPVAKEGLVKVRFISPRIKADIPYVMPLALSKSYLEGVRPLRLPLNYRVFISLTLCEGSETIDLPPIELRPENIAL